MYSPPESGEPVGFLPPKDWMRNDCLHPGGGTEDPTTKPTMKKDKDAACKKKKSVLNKACFVCGAPAAEHVHYGAICCYSCRAFFRRSGSRNYQCIRGDNQCEVNTKFRKYCKKCRYKKCIDSGMKPELVDASLRNKEADLSAAASASANSEKMRSVSPNKAQSSAIKTEAPVTRPSSSSADYWNSSRSCSSATFEDHKDAIPMPYKMFSVAGGMPWHRMPVVNTPAMMDGMFPPRMPALMQTGQPTNMANLMELTANQRHIQQQQQSPSPDPLMMMMMSPSSAPPTPATCTKVSTIQINPAKQINPHFQRQQESPIAYSADDQESSIIESEEDEEMNDLSGVWNHNLFNTGETMVKSMYNISNAISQGNQRVSVIQGPRKISEEDKCRPYKKRNCVKMCKEYSRKFLFCDPVIKLTLEEKKFIDKRVREVRMLVSMVQPQQTASVSYRPDSLENDRKSALSVFRDSFSAVFGKLRGNLMFEVDQLGLMESRFLCCALTSIAVRLFGGSNERAMISQEFKGKYSDMLRSPWACSYEGEEKVICTLQQLGEVIGSDERLEVLFTTCIMRGFQDPRAVFMQMERGNRHKAEPPLTNLNELEPGHPGRTGPGPEEARCACEDPNLLTGVQFSLLLYRYIKDCKNDTQASNIFKKLEGLIHPLYECQNIFYFGRLNI